MILSRAFYKRLSMAMLILLSLQSRQYGLPFTPSKTDNGQGELLLEWWKSPFVATLLLFHYVVEISGKETNELSPLCPLYYPYTVNF